MQGKVQVVTYQIREHDPAVIRGYETVRLLFLVSLLLILALGVALANGALHDKGHGLDDGAVPVLLDIVAVLALDAGGPATAVAGRVLDEGAGREGAVDGRDGDHDRSGSHLGLEEGY